MSQLELRTQSRWNYAQRSVGKPFRFKGYSTELRHLTCVRMKSEEEEMLHCSLGISKSPVVTINTWALGQQFLSVMNPQDGQLSKVLEYNNLYRGSNDNRQGIYTMLCGAARTAGAGCTTGEL